MIENPYRKLQIDLIKVQGRVSPLDYAFLKKKFPFCTGITDKIISTIYKKFIDELRRIDSITPVESAFHVDSAGYELLERLLSGVRFGVDVGSEGRSDDSGGTGGVRQEMHGDAEQRTDQKSRTPGRRRKNSEEKERGKK